MRVNVWRPFGKQNAYIQYVGPELLNKGGVRRARIFFLLAEYPTQNYCVPGTRYGAINK